jgi:DNA-binding NarL/FixJ family response regulator
VRQSIAVLIAERESLFRRGLSTCLSADPRFEVLASVGTAREAYRAVSQLRPAIALVGTTLPDRPGLMPTAELRLRDPALAIIVLADRVNDDDLVAASCAGAAAYLSKDVTEDELLQTMRRIANDEFLINEHLAQRAATRPSRGEGRTVVIGAVARPNSHPPLTGRELQILNRMSSGMTNAEIGFALGISVQTVKNHVTSILRKLAVTDRTQAVVLAMRRGWVVIDDIGPEPTSPPMVASVWGMLPRR